MANTIAQNWTNKMLVVGLYKPSASSAQYTYFYSKENTAAASSPYLNITYISNYAPTLIANSTNTTPVYTNTDVPVNLTCSDSNAGDTITGYAKPYINGTVYTTYSKTVTNGTNTQLLTFGSGNFTKHDNITFELWCGDGTVNTTHYNTTSIEVQNSLPATPSGYTNLGMHETDHTPPITWTNGADADGDTIRTFVYVGTTSTPTDQDTNTTNEFTSLGNMVSLADGTTYYYRLRTWDGEAFSSAYTIADTFHMNDEPSTTAPSIIPSTIYSYTTTIECQNGTTLDPDGDAVIFAYNWYRNNVSLSVNNRNLTVGNYTVNDELICEHYVADSYETNATKFNSSTITVTDLAPVINWNRTYITNGSLDMTPGLFELVNLTANITDIDANLDSVIFNVTAPNGTVVLLGNATQTGEIWFNSFSVTSTGVWRVNITANDTGGNVVYSNWTFNVSLGTLSITPTSKTYSQKSGYSELWNFTISHTGNSNNTVILTGYDYLTSLQYFKVILSDALTGLELSNLTLRESETRIVTANITSNSSLASGQYKSNITFNRTEDSASQNVTITATISALAGDIALSPTSWSVSMNDAQSSSQTFRITNNGDYALSGCNASMTTLSSYFTSNLTSFGVAAGSYTDMAISLANMSVGSYSDDLLVVCTATANGGQDANLASVSATITAAPAVVVTSPSSGGGGTTPQPVIIKTQYSIDNIDQYVERYSGTITKIYRDEFRVVNDNLFDVNITLSIQCAKDNRFCDYVYFDLKNGMRAKEVVASVDQKAGLAPGYVYVTLAHIINETIPNGNYTYYLYATSSDNVVISTPMVVNVNDKPPNIFQTFGYYFTESRYLSGIVITGLFVLIMLFLYISYRRKSKKAKMYDEQFGKPSVVIGPEISQTRK